MLNNSGARFTKGDMPKEIILLITIVILKHFQFFILKSCKIYPLNLNANATVGGRQ